MMHFPHDRLFDVVGLGRNSWDRIALVREYPGPDRKLSVDELDNQPGGQVATTIVTVARLGVRARYLGKFGDDAGGRAVRGALVREGIDLSESKVLPGVSNQSAFIVVDRKAKTRNVFSHTDPRLRIRSDDFPMEAATSGKILYLGARSPMDVLAYARDGRQAGSVIAIDADTVVDGLRDLTSHTDVFLCPADVPMALTGASSLERALVEIAEMGPSIVCCTRGANGATALIGGRLYSSPAFRTDVVDTTGAGDVFQGAFLVGLLEGLEPAPLLKFSNTVAALKCRTLGGQRGIPTRLEVETWVHTS